MKYTGGPMTEAMYYVLLTLMNPSHGYGLMNEIKEVSNGRIEDGTGHALRGSCSNAKRKPYSFKRRMMAEEKRTKLQRRGNELFVMNIIV